MGIVDDYLLAIDDAGKREALAHIRDVVTQTVPGTQEVISYGIPAFAINGKVILGFAVTRQGMSLYPFSGAAVSAFADRLQGFSMSSGTIRFTAEKPIPDEILKEIIANRLKAIASEKK